MDQRELWQGEVGRNWVAAQDLTDGMLQPFEDLLVRDARPGVRLLDVGCGTGATTVALARKSGAEGRCVGVDLSEPMIVAARERASRAGTPVTFRCADAAEYPFEPGGFDEIVSRFGVMFFDDPVRAFANLRAAASPEARLRCVVWRGPEHNPFMTAAERAAAPLVDLPSNPPDAPGRFSFADPDRVRGILTGAGWADVAFERVDAPCTLPEADLIPYITRFGPLGRILPEMAEQDRAELVAAVRAAFDGFVDGSAVRYTAGCWLITARPAEH